MASFVKVGGRLVNAKARQAEVPGDSDACGPSYSSSNKWFTILSIEKLCSDERLSAAYIEAVSEIYRQRSTHQLQPDALLATRLRKIHGVMRDRNAINHLTIIVGNLKSYFEGKEGGFGFTPGVKEVLNACR